MSLKLILGPSGSGKSRTLFETAQKEARKDPRGHYLILVPEQFTMQTQQQLCRLSPEGGILNIDILSFSRLAVRVFEETGVRKKALLGETGKILLLRLIGSREASGLSLLKGALDRPGVLSELKSILSELDQYEVSDDELQRMAESCKDRPNLAGKLRQIGELRKKYRDFQTEHDLQTAETVPEALCLRIPRSAALEGCHIYLDGYTGFTPSQLDVLSELMRKADCVTVTLTIDPEEGMFGKAGENDLFGLSKKTIESLIRIAKKTQTPVEEPLLLKPSGVEKQGRFEQGSAIWYLERHLFRKGRKIPMPEGGDDGSVRIISCPEPAQEAKAAVSVIRRLTLKEQRGDDRKAEEDGERGEKLRYRDIAVIAGSFAAYSEYLRRAFTEAEIPFFLDQPVPVTLNPAFEFVSDAFAVLDSGYSYESMMALLRTGYVFEDRAKTDRLENYLLAAGIRGKKRWNAEWTRTTRRFPEESLGELEALRQEFMEKFGPFAKAAGRGTAKLRDYAVALWKLMDDFALQQKLAGVADAREECGERAEAEIYRQAASVIAEVLDEAVSLMGEEKVKRQQFEQILEAGFSEAKIGIIPPGTDEVHIGDLTRSRMPNVKALIFLGMNDDFIPARQNFGGILTDMERDYLRQQDFHLAPSAKEDARIQKFYLYMTLTKPSKMLVLTYSRTGADGKAKRPADALRQIRTLLPGLVETEGIPGGKAGQIYLPGETVKTLSEEIASLRNKSEEEKRAEAPYLQELFLAARELEPERTKDLIRSLMPEKLPKLSGETARKLYGEVLDGSVSRLEKFALCPFQQFTIYGLGLQERERFEVKAADVGSVMHRAMELLSGRVKGSREYTWKTLPGETLDAWSEESLKEAALETSQGKFSDSFRSAAQYRRLLGIFRHSARVMKIQLAAGDFQPSFFEVRFDSKGQVKASPLVFEGGGSMQLTGRIDRIDEAVDQDKGKVYIKVIDYKTGSTTFDMKDVYMGTELQLVVYMDFARAMEQRKHKDDSVVCAGILYFPMKDPVLDTKYAAKEESEIELERIRRIRPSGLVLDDPDVYSHLSSDPDRISEVAPVQFNKDGSVSGSRSSVAVQKDFELLSEFADRKMTKMGEDILDGNIAPSPLRESDQQNACTYCSMKQICRFQDQDPVLKAREPVKGSRDDILAMMREELKSSKSTDKR